MATTESIPDDTTQTIVGDDTTLVDETTPVIDTTLPNVGEDIYDGCGQTKVCFGYPNRCYLDKECVYFGGVTYDGKDFIFELLSMSK